MPAAWIIVYSGVQLFLIQVIIYCLPRQQKTHDLTSAQLVYIALWQCLVSSVRVRAATAVLMARTCLQGSLRQLLHTDLLSAVLRAEPWSHTMTGPDLGGLQHIPIILLTKSTCACSFPTSTL